MDPQEPGILCVLTVGALIIRTGRGALWWQNFARNTISDFFTQAYIVYPYLSIDP